MLHERGVVQQVVPLLDGQVAAAANAVAAVQQGRTPSDAVRGGIPVEAACSGSRHRSSSSTGTFRGQAQHPMLGKVRHLVHVPLFRTAENGMHTQ